MSASVRGAAELDAALAALKRIEEMVAEGRTIFDRNHDRQLALVFLWANVGSQLKQYGRRLDIPTGAEPFAGPIQVRDKLVYGSVQALDAEVVWDTCVLNGPELYELVTDLRVALRRD